MLNKYKMYDENTILFDCPYMDEEDVRYAIYHRFNIRFTETKSSNFIDILAYKSILMVRLQHLVK